MDTIDTPTTDVVVIEDAAVVEIPVTDSFGKEVGKTLAISAATTAGMLVGAFAIGFAAKKVEEFKTRRAEKKAAEKVHVVTDLPESPKTEN